MHQQVSSKERTRHFMKTYTIELQEVADKWLAHIAEITGETPERLIADAVYNHLYALEEDMQARFIYREQD